VVWTLPLERGGQGCGSPHQTVSLDHAPRKGGYLYSFCLSCLSYLICPSYPNYPDRHHYSPGGCGIWPPTSEGHCKSRAKPSGGVGYGHRHRRGTANPVPNFRGVWGMTIAIGGGSRAEPSRPPPEGVTEPSRAAPRPRG